MGGARTLEERYARAARHAVVRVVSLTDDEMRTAYSGASAVLNPSRYEGFGLVNLEAMACGCPVITCRNSALPESSGEAAIYVREDAPEELAKAMRDVLDPDTREQRVKAGLEWSRGFRWAQTAAGLANAITSLADSKTTPPCAHEAQLR